MTVPKKLFYTRDHEWVSSENGIVTIGISSYAVEQLGDIVHIELPECGDTFEKGDSFGTVESTKTVSDLYTPAKCKVININEKLSTTPEVITADPYSSWLIKLQLEGELDEELMDAPSYEDYLKKG